MILATPITSPYPVDAFLKPASKESSDIATVVCSTNSKKPCIIPVRVGLFFDGTNNNMVRDRNGTRTELDGKPKKSGAIAQPSLGTEQASHSNVARLFLAFPNDQQSSGYFSHYIQGVGTPFKEIGEWTETNDGKGRSQKPSATPSAVRCRHGENLQTFNNPGARRRHDDARRPVLHPIHC